MHQTIYALRIRGTRPGATALMTRELMTAGSNRKAHIATYRDLPLNEEHLRAAHQDAQSDSAVAFEDWLTARAP